MCTVTFLPLDHGGYLLGTNRDESPSRGEARAPAVRVTAGRRVLAPMDTDAGGTWIATDEQGRTLCVLNGDRPPVLPVPEAPLSRGVLVLRLMETPAIDSVESRLRATVGTGRLAVKPFKLLVAEPGSEGRPAQSHLLQWDGARIERFDASGPRMLVSSTFEADAVDAHRRDDFLAWRERHGSASGPELVGALKAWHASHRAERPSGDAYSVCMHRDDARSVSFTLVRVGPESVRMSYRAGSPCASGAFEESRLERRSGARV